MRSSRCARALLVALVATAGCGGYVYRSFAPALHTVASADGEFAVASLATEDAQGATNVTVTVATHGVAPRIELLGANLTVAGAAPCSAGSGLYQLSLAEVPVWRRPVALAGEQELRMAFNDAGWALTGPSVLDLLLVEQGQSRCVRLNVVTHTAHDRWTTGPWWLDFRLRSYYPVGADSSGDSRASGPHHDGHSGIIRFGRFVGPINLGLGLEAGIAGCADVCLPRDDYFGIVGAGPSVQGVMLDRGRLVLTGEAAYDFLALQEQHREDEGRPPAAADWPGVFLHGPRLGVGIFYATRPALAGAVHDLRAMYGVEFFGAYRRHETGAAVVVGLSLVLGGPIL